MKYPNAYKGVTKILVTEILEVVVSVLAAAFLLIQFTMYPNSDDPGAFPGLLIFMIVIAVIGVFALVLYLVGVVQAKKEEHEFKLALIMTIIALVLMIASESFSFITPVVGEWIEFGCEIIELLAFESVVGGVVNLAEKIGDEKVLSIGKRMRILVTFIWIAMIAAKALEFVSGNAAEYVKMAHSVLELADHILYLILLVKGRKMLAREQAEVS